MKNLKFYLVLLFGFFLIPFAVNADINVQPLGLNDDDFFTIINYCLNLDSSIDIIGYASSTSLDNIRFYCGKINTNNESFQCKYDIYFSNGVISNFNSNTSGYLLNPWFINFWSSNLSVRFSSPNDTFKINSSYDTNYFTFGNPDYFYLDSFAKDSIFYRHFGYYDLSNIDSEPPFISLVGNNDITIEINSIWNDPGFSCSDNVDTFCNVNVSSDLVVNVLGDYTITYNATDSAGNIAEAVYRYVHVVDTIPPNISFIGDSVIHLSLDSVYEELGVNVSDNSNEEIIPHIDSSTLDVNNVGTYYINYLACDSSDNCSSLKRVVKVQSVVPLDFSGSQYLLFDFSDIQDMFPKINFSGLTNTDEFIIVILFNIFFLIFIFIIIWIILKSVYKCISIIWG